MQCMLYIDPSPLWSGGGVDRRAYPVPPHTIGGGGGAVITDHGIIHRYTVYISYIPIDPKKIPDEPKVSAVVL